MDSQSDRTRSVYIERVGHVANLVLNAAAKRNALNGPLARAVRSALDSVFTDSSIGALIVSAAGPAFCAGGDLDLLRRAGKSPTSSESYDELGDIYRVFVDLLNAPIPTVSAVQGAAVGAGINLALATDVCIAAEDAVFRGFGSAAMHPGGGHLSMLLQKAPFAAAPIALFNVELTAEAAYEARLVWRVVRNDDLLDQALRLAAEAAVEPDLARRVTATYRAARAARLGPSEAVLLERAPQMWSLQRAFQLSRKR